MGNYSHDEMYKILQYKLNHIDNWKYVNTDICNNIEKEHDKDKTLKTHTSVSFHETWFKDKMKYFNAYGRDIDKLISKIKIAHSKRVFCLEKEVKKFITDEDILKGFEMYKQHTEITDEYNYSCSMFT